MLRFPEALTSTTVEYPFLMHFLLTNLKHVPVFFSFLELYISFKLLNITVLQSQIFSQIDLMHKFRKRREIQR